jgi:hypothetical protein
MATRALVLSGGGLVGTAWESGLLAGLSESGVDLAQADLIVGTSAGSFVGAQVAMGRSASSIVEAILAEDPARSFSTGGRPMKVPDMSVLLGKMAEAVSGVRPAEQVRAEIGTWALSTETRMSEKEFIASFRRSFGGLPEDFWPERPYACHCHRCGRWIVRCVEQGFQGPLGRGSSREVIRFRGVLFTRCSATRLTSARSDTRACAIRANIGQSLNERLGKEPMATKSVATSNAQDAARWRRRHRELATSRRPGSLFHQEGRPGCSESIHAPCRDLRRAATALSSSSSSFGSSDSTASTRVATAV